MSQVPGRKKKKIPRDEDVQIGRQNFQMMCLYVCVCMSVLGYRLDRYMSEC